MKVEFNNHIVNSSPLAIALHAVAGKIKMIEFSEDDEEELLINRIVITKLNNGGIIVNVMFGDTSNCLVLHSLSVAAEKIEAYINKYSKFNVTVYN